MSAFSLRHRLAGMAAAAALIGVALPVASATVASAAPRGPISTVNVPASGSWVDSGAYLRSSLALVTGTGTVFTGSGLVGPYGDSGCVAPISAPAPGLPCDALVGKIGTGGTPFVVGNSDYVHVASHGELYLAVNTASFTFGGFHSTVLPLP
jgi:hypothetical protein